MIALCVLVTPHLILLADTTLSWTVTLTALSCIIISFALEFKNVHTGMQLCNINFV